MCNPSASEYCRLRLAAAASVAIIPPVEVRFTPSNQDALNAMRATSMPVWGMFTFVLLLILLFLVGIYLLDHDLIVIGWIWIGMSATVGLLTYEIPRYSLRRAMAQNPSAQGEITFVFTEVGVAAMFPTGESRLGWQAFTKFKETEHLFLIFFSRYGYNYVPKRVMSPGEVDELRGILKSRVGLVR